MKTWLRLFLFIVLGLAGAAGGWQGVRAAAPLAPTLTLQERITGAADGASLDIDAGTYTENLTIVDKNITLRGANRDTTIIQAASSSQRVITATSNKGLRLENLTITGGGVNAAGGTLQIVNCHITNNSAAYGGGVFLDSLPLDPLSNLVVSNSLVDFNSASITGGGLYAAGSVTLYNTNLDSNTAYWHGGGLHVGNGSTVITGGVFTYNSTTAGNGGAVDINNALTISGAQFTGNTSGVFGGAVSQWNAGYAVSITDSHFTENTTKNKGGGAYVAGLLTLTGSEFTSNKVLSGGTGAVYGGGLYAGGSLTITNTNFFTNTADSGDNGQVTGDDAYGGGVYAAGALQVDTSTFSGNQALCHFCSFTCGGGLYSDIRTGTVTVTNSSFVSNHGWFGGGLGAYTTLSVTHSSFTNNQGGYGGGIDTPTLTGDWLLFQDNHVVNGGGGVDASNITLTHSRFIHNSAQKGGAIQVWDILYPSSNLLFAENSASYGAAVHTEAGAAATLYNVTIARSAQAVGPAIYLDANAALNLYNSIVNNYTNAITFSSGGSLTEDYNLFYNNNIDVVGGTLYSGGHSTGLLPPGFIDPAAGNYHLKSNSFAIAAGHNYGLADDLDGRLRLSGRNDAGAYQFWASVFIPTIRK